MNTRQIFVHEIMTIIRNAYTVTRMYMLPLTLLGVAWINYAGRNQFIGDFASLMAILAFLLSATNHFSEIKSLRRKKSSISSISRKIS
jgi:hypothetical protein